MSEPGVVPRLDNVPELDIVFTLDIISLIYNCNLIKRNKDFCEGLHQH